MIFAKMIKYLRGVLDIAASFFEKFENRKVA